MSALKTDTSTNEGRRRTPTTRVSSHSDTALASRRLSAPVARRQSATGTTAPSAARPVDLAATDRPAAALPRQVKSVFWRRPLNVGIILVVLLVVGLVIYPVLQDWWKVRRDNQVLVAENQAVLDRNAQIAQMIATLNTPEGIESRAREQFGWIMPGEQGVNVLGLGPLDRSSAVPPSIAPDSIHPEVDWWTATVDFLLGYEYPTAPDAGTAALPGNL